MKDALRFFTPVIVIGAVLWQIFSGFFTRPGNRWVGAGIKAYQKGDFETAKQDFNEAVKVDPKNKDAYFNRAVFYSQQKNYGLAIADYTQYIEMAPDYAGYFGRGTAYDANGNSEKALLDLNKAVELKPEFAQTYNNRALVYLKLKEYEKGRQDVLRARSLGFQLVPKIIEEFKQAGIKL